MALPLLLAGPILRRVDPNLVSVWLALSQPAKVSLVVYEGTAVAAGATPFLTSAPEDTWRVGDKLHFALVSARIGETDARSLQPDTLYSYDVSIIAGGTPHDLASLNMLRDATAADSPDGHAHLALGYQPDHLPSFAPCPSKLPDVRILYGSCRLPSCRDPDALAYVDDYIHDHVQDPRSRPHQLILGGDQVYADDVDTLMMIGLIELAGEIIGLDPATQTPVEHLLVDKIMKCTGGAGINLDTAHQFYAEDTSIAPADRLLPADAATFPRRVPARAHQARRPVDEQRRRQPRALLRRVRRAVPARVEQRLLDRRDTRRDVRSRRHHRHHRLDAPAAEVDVETDAEEPHRSPPAGVPQARVGAPLPEARSAGQARHSVRRQEGQGRCDRGAQAPAEVAAQPQDPRRLHRRPAEGATGAGQRADLHDARRPRRSPTTCSCRRCGATGCCRPRSARRSLFNNGMLAYALFQDWGNDPLRYDSGLPAELRTRATELFPAGATTGPAAGAVRTALGAVRPRPAQRGRRRRRFPRRQPADPLALHGRRRRPTALIVARQPHPPQLRRARRPARQRVGRRAGRSGAQAAAAAGREVLVVIAPLQVIGPPVIDELVAPASFRVFDLVIAAKSSDFDTSDSRRAAPPGCARCSAPTPMPSRRGRSTHRSVRAPPREAGRLRTGGAAVRRRAQLVRRP